MTFVYNCNHKDFGQLVIVQKNFYTVSYMFKQQEQKIIQYL